MRADPNAEWCHRCSRPGHNELNCPYEECDTCDGTGDEVVELHTIACHACKGRGYHYINGKEP